MAIAFDGTGDWYETTSTAGAGGSCSLFVWAKSSNWDFNGGASVGGLWVPVGEWGGDTNGDFGLATLVGSNVINLAVHTSGGRVNVSTPYPSTDEWHRIAGVYDESANRAYLYIDDPTYPVAIGTTSGTRGTPNTGNGTAIGAYPNNGANTGALVDIAEAVFWNRVLTNQELYELLADEVDPSSAASDAVLYFPCDSAADPLVDDGSAGNDLTENGDPSTTTHPTFGSSSFGGGGGDAQYAFVG